ncbi:MAG: hypothetical protein R2910_02500 [Gemmatimonadales bacterium]
MKNGSKTMTPGTASYDEQAAALRAANDRITTDNPLDRTGTARAETPITSLHPTGAIR